jgi:hypothetical protein
MKETKTYQNEGINHYGTCGEATRRQITNYPNKLYTIYEEFDAKYFYKLMKEGYIRKLRKG